MNGFGQTPPSCTPSPNPVPYLFLGLGLAAAVLLPGFWKVLGLGGIAVGVQQFSCMGPGELLTNAAGVTTCYQTTQPQCIFSL
jgi:hypothetical protein